MADNDHYPKIYLYKRIVQAKIFIDQNYTDPIDLGHISGEAHFSKFHFSRLFKNIYGKTPYQYLTSVRMEKALQLFRSETNISLVCFSVGFESPTSFSGLFKRIIGVSPSAYLARQQHTQNEINKMPLAFVPSCFAHQHGWTKNSNIEEV